MLRGDDRFIFQIFFNYLSNTNDLINMQIKYGEIVVEADYSTSSLQNYQDELAELLTNYQKSSSREDLHELVTLGKKAYKFFYNKLPECDKKVLNHVVRDSSHGHNSIICQVYFPINFTFPVSLLYVDSSDKDYDDKISVYSGFLGNRLSIRKRFIRKGKDSKKNNLFNINDRDESVRVLHAIDKSISNHKEEEKIFENDGFFDTIKVHSKNDLLKHWANRNYPEILHFTSHYGYDEKSEDYFVSLSNDDLFVRDVISSIDSLERKPLIFLNGCRGGVSKQRRAFNIIYELVPKHSIGFITTMHNTDHDVAYEMAKEFYEGFLGGRSLIDALEKAKIKVMFSESLNQKLTGLGAITYGLWEVSPSLLIRRQTTYGY